MSNYRTYLEIPIDIDYEWDDGRPRITSIEIGQGEPSDKIILPEHAKNMAVINLEDHLTEIILTRLEEEIQDNYDPTPE